MRTYYQPESSEFWLQYLLDQQYGGAYPSFVGMPYQRGAGIGSFFRGLFRAVAPIVRTVAPMARSVGKAVGKEALKAGANILADTAQGRPFNESLKEHARAAVGQSLRESGDIIQKGRGIGSRKGLKRRRKRKRDIYDGY